MLRRGGAHRRWGPRKAALRLCGERRGGGMSERPAIRTTNKIPKAEVREALLSLQIDFCRPSADQYAQKSCYKS